MRVILLKNVTHIGKIHDIVEVKDGYGKNYLIKNKLAVIYTPTASDKLQQDLTNIANIDTAKRQSATSLKQKLEQITLAFKLKANQGHAFGSISLKAIINQLLEQYQIKLDKYMFEDNEQKQISLGQHVLTIRLYANIVATLRVKVSEEL
jgi:large subunit ribosomal protein L9